MIRVDIGRVTQFPDMTDRPLMSTTDPAQPSLVIVQPYADRLEPMQFALERLVRSVRRREVSVVVCGPYEVPPPDHARRVRT